MKISLDRADTLFSQWVRLRDLACVRCGSLVRFNPKGLPISHTNSHYFSRRKENTRFEPDNCDTLCWGCHSYWASDDKEGYRQFKIKQLGQKNFDLLLLASNITKKKDRKSEIIYWRQRLKQDFRV